VYRDPGIRLLLAARALCCYVKWGGIRGGTTAIRQEVEKVSLWLDRLQKTRDVVLLDAPPSMRRIRKEEESNNSIRRGSHQNQRTGGRGSRSNDTCLLL
jgi:hypothetical protein